MKLTGTIGDRYLQPDEISIYLPKWPVTIAQVLEARPADLGASVWTVGRDGTLEERHRLRGRAPEFASKRLRLAE